MLKHNALKAGLNPDEYWNSALEDVLEMIQAHEQNEVEKWRRNREITYTLYCANTSENERVSKSEWLQLPGEIIVTAADRKQQMIDRWKEKGMLS